MPSALWTTGRPYLHCSQRALGFYLYHYVRAYFTGFTPQPPGRRGPMSRYLPQTLVPSRCPFEPESGGLGLSPPLPGLTSHYMNGFISLGLPTHLPELCVPGGPEVKTRSITINPLGSRRNLGVGVSGELGLGGGWRTVVVNALMGSIGTPKVQPWSFLSSFFPVSLLLQPIPFRAPAVPWGQSSASDSNLRC